MTADDGPRPSHRQADPSRTGPDHSFAGGSAKSHVLYVSPTWARDRGRAFDADALVRELVDCGVDCIELYAKDHHGNLYFPSRHGQDYGRDIVGETLEACRREGVRFIAYLSVAFDERSAALHPDWLTVDVGGRPRTTGPFRWLCLRSGYRDLMLGQIEDLVTGYDVDGLWLDIVPIAWPAPYTTTAGEGARVWMLHDIVPCYCHACRDQHQQETGRPIPLEPDPDDELAIFEFGIRGTRALIDAARAILGRERPEALVTYNGSGAPGDAVDSGDLVSIEGHAPHYGRQDLIARWARGKGRPFEVLTAGALPSSPTGWNGFDRKPTEVVELERAITRVHGGSTVFGHAPFPDGHSLPAQFDGIRQAAHAFASLEAVPVGARNVADVLLAAPIKALDAPRQAGRMLEAVEWWNDVLRGGHLLHDIAGLDRDLGQYRLVVLPDQLAMSDAEIEGMRAYVAAGGSLLATGGSATFDERGRRRRGSGLADIVGASVGDPSGNAFTYITSVEPDFAEGLPGTPLVVNRESFRVTASGGRPVMRTADPERPFGAGTTLLWGYPPPDDRVELDLAVAHGFGQGRSLYVAVGLDGPPVGEPWATGGLEAVWTRRLAENLVRALVPSPTLVTDASPAVEIVLAEEDDLWHLHLVDHASGDPRYIPSAGQTHVSAPIRVVLDADRIPADEATRADGRPVRIRRADGQLEVTVDDLATVDHVSLRRRRRIG